MGTFVMVAKYQMHVLTLDLLSPDRSAFCVFAEVAEDDQSILPLDRAVDCVDHHFVVRLRGGPFTPCLFDQVVTLKVGVTHEKGFHLLLSI